MPQRDQYSLWWSALESGGGHPRARCQALTTERYFCAVATATGLKSVPLANTGSAGLGDVLYKRQYGLPPGPLRELALLPPPSGAQSCLVTVWDLVDKEGRQPDLLHQKQWPETVRVALEAAGAWVSHGFLPPPPKDDDGGAAHLLLGVDAAAAVSPACMT
jgi:hypothetical protein